MSKKAKSRPRKDRIPKRAFSAEDEISLDEFTDHGKKPHAIADRFLRDLRYNCSPKVIQYIETFLKARGWEENQGSKYRPSEPIQYRFYGYLMDGVPIIFPASEKKDLRSFVLVRSFMACAELLERLEKVSPEVQEIAALAYAAGMEYAEFFTNELRLKGRGRPQGIAAQRRKALADAAEKYAALPLAERQRKTIHDLIPKELRTALSAKTEANERSALRKTMKT